VLALLITHAPHQKHSGNEIATPAKAKVIIIKDPRPHFSLRIVFHNNGKMTAK